MKASDLLAEWLAKNVKHVFCISGGASLHMIHSIAARKDITFICPQHECNAGFAADAYARLRGDLGCAVTTSGPGATNLLTAISCSYYDSIPMLYITGQTPTSRLDVKGTRQIGFQYTPIVEMARPITKYAKTVVKASELINCLEEAALFARGGRQGPVLVDVPDDIQRATV